MLSFMVNTRFKINSLMCTRPSAAVFRRGIEFSGQTTGRLCHVDGRTWSGRTTVVRLPRRSQVSVTLSQVSTTCFHFSFRRKSDLQGRVRVSPEVAIRYSVGDVPVDRLLLPQNCIEYWFRNRFPSRIFVGLLPYSVGTLVRS